MSSEYVKLLNALPRPDLYDSWELVKRHMPIEQPPSTASYIVFQKGGQCYAKNGTTGHIEFGPGDASTVIQSAINALTSGRTWKEKVAVKGNFTLTERIDIPSYTVLDLSQAKFAFQNNANPTPVSFETVTIYTMLTNADHTNGNSDITIIGGRIEGNSANQNLDRNWALVWFHNVTHGKLLNMDVRDVKCSGMDAPKYNRAFCYLLTQCTDVTVKGCYGYDAGYEVLGIRNGNKYIRVMDCMFEKGGVHVLQVADGWWSGATGSEAIDVGHSHLKATVEDVFTIHASQKVRFHHNLCELGSASICMKLIGSCSDVWIENNRIVASTGHGIMLGDAGTPGTVEKVHIIGNEIQIGSGSYYGIKLGDTGCTVQNIDIFNNRIINSGYNGIYNSGTVCSRVNIVGNNIYAVYRAVDINQGLTNSVIANNMLRGTTAVCYLVGVTNTVITGNYTYDGSWGIDESSNCDYNRIIANNVLGIATVSQRVKKVGANTLVKQNIGYITEGSRTATFSGNGSQTVFTIAHELVGTPKMAVVTAGSSDAKGDFYVTYDATNITVTYATAPPSGTNNVVLNWYAEM
jgi:hypothetical protein